MSLGTIVPPPRRTLRLVTGLVLGLLALSWGSPSGTAAGPDSAIDFDRQVRPLLSDNCFQCHGPDEKQRKAGLRLDVKEGAFARLRDGGFAIVPGHADQSELIRRVSEGEPGRRMPPARTNKHLTDQQVELLRRWIDQGAPWARHWSFIPPRRPDLPPVREAGWPRNPVDRFILARLEAEGLRPAPEADRVTLIRRVTLDLTGLPPTPAEVDDFLADKSPDAYERVVERLLANPHYGERMALDWLDAARFADTHGYHIDSGRDMTRWREWVLDAFNQNKPFDRFTVEQLAGDLLPGATLKQRVASGFNRNHMINFEGGAIPEEYHNAYVVDRVNTTATVWLGLSVACAQCHDHKFDPVTQKEYYQLYAFFHNVPENGLDGTKGNAAPLLQTPSPAQQRDMDRLRAEIKRLEAQAAPPRPAPAATVDAKKPAAPPKEDPPTERLKQARKALAELEKQVPSTMVMQELPQPRDTFVLVRGQYDKKGQKVTAGVPASLPPLPPGSPLNRLGLARWLVDPGHPLTARVIVNRYWQAIFGAALVRTPEDFGVQGQLPTHPELLDWLAVEFMNPSGDGKTPWDVKALQRLLVTSATYRQSSVITPELLARDPENRLWARASRHRLPAEFIRDQALAVSGLLDQRIGGKSVFPYQPPGLWEELASRLDGANWTAQTYTPSHGHDLYRRTLYTFWKRTSPPPTLATFDAPDREICTVRRARTNTPLQALVLMNDPTYTEAARKLAERILVEGGASVPERVTFAFRLATARKPGASEQEVLSRLYEDQLAHYRKDPEAARKLLTVGEAPRNDRFEPAELAAWATFASVLLNLDETVTRG